MGFESEQMDTFAAHAGWSLKQVIEEYEVLGYVAVIDGDKTTMFFAQSRIAHGSRPLPLRA